MKKKPTPSFVDLLIKDIPFDVYLDMRKKLISKGYSVIGYQSGYHEREKEKEL